MHGDLDSLLKRGPMKFSLFERMKMAKDAALGINWLHHSNPKIVHRDLKTANLLVFRYFAASPFIFFGVNDIAYLVQSTC